jgi:protein-disulfide isomerase
VQEYELKRKALEEAISKKLLQAEAEKLGTTPEELLKKEVDSKVAAPTDQEVEEEFVRQMFQNGGAATQDKDQVREQLKKEFSQDARDDFFQKLRQQAGVKILLVPPKIEVSPDPARVRGNPDAKITIVEVSDFQCPYCLQAYSTVKDLLKKYDGKIKLSYRDLPLQETQGKIPGTGEAARCALEQGKFWEYHDLLFENQDAYGADAFRDFAETLKLDGDKFAACLDSGKYKAPVHADLQEAMRLGIKGTPAFFIDGVPLSGARPQSEFEEVIDAELAALEP